MKNQFSKFALQQISNLSTIKYLSLLEVIKMRILILLLVSGAVTGCASFLTLDGTIGVKGSAKLYECGHNYNVPRVYGGVFYDVSLLQDPDRGPLAPLVLVDILFSAIFDTVMLVVTVPGQLAWGNLCPSEEDGRISNA
jgi:uncharacterized protein YceK